MGLVHDDFRDKYIKQINRDLLGSVVTSYYSPKRVHRGTIEAVLYIKTKKTDDDFLFEFAVEYDTYKATEAIDLERLDSQYIKFAKADAIKKWLTDLPKAYAEWKVEKAKLDKLKKEQELQRRIEREIEEEERKLTLRYNKRVAKALDKVNNMEDVEITDNFYTALGWLAKHTTSISATMPDFMENWFIGKLGRVRRSIVSSDIYTENGNAMKWSLSMSLRVDTLDHLPGYLIDKVKKNKVLNNTRLVFELCDKYGFKVGDKTQDITTIKENIPTDHIEEFEIGVNS